MLKFSTELWDGFEVVSKRTEEGVNAAKEIANFLKKVSTLYDEFGKNLIKLCKPNATQTLPQKIMQKKEAPKKNLEL